MNEEDNDHIHTMPEDKEIEKAEDLIREGEGEYSDADALSDLELNEIIESLCLSKVEEFIMLGYEHVSGKEIWDCVSEKYRKTGVPPLHQVVNDILSLKSTQFMNWMTLSAYKGAQF
ncbi:post-transcriptional regulator [Paenibacillus sp. SI8]|uniref:post-transcriptional regulator n=1 Tax=unclassified Paenibacillus TaxID=185978 RepID=UPI0034670BC2